MSGTREHRLHENDFIMASEIDRMFDRSDGPPDRQ